MCEICEHLYTNERLKKHYLMEHNKVQCRKCGVLLDADDVGAIRIHNRKCYTGFKDRRFDSDDFHIETLTALENSIVTYQCLLRRPPIEKEIVRDDLDVLPPIEKEIVRDDLEDVLSIF